MQIFIKLLDGKTKTIEIRQDDSVELLMERVKEIIGMPLKYQRLLYGGKQLDPDRFLSDYGVTPESTIHLVARLLGGPPRDVFLDITIKDLEGGRTLTRKISPTQNIDELMVRLHNIELLNTNNKLIVFERNILDREKDFSYYGVSHKSTLYLVPKMQRCSCGYS
jgi:hypothetical protein